MAYNIGPKIVTNGLVAAYDPSNPKSGNGSIDLSNNGRNLTLNDVNVGGSGARKYLQNTGGGNAAETGYTPTGVWTIDIWFELMSIPVVEEFLVKSVSSNFSDITITNNGEGDAAVNINGPRGTSQVAKLIYTGTHHLTTYLSTNTSDDNVKVYLDGLNPYVELEAGTLETLQPLELLGISGDILRIYTIHIYNRELSAAEVLQNHNALRSRFGK